MNEAHKPQFEVRTAVHTTQGFIDISVDVGTLTPRWPGSPPFSANRWLDLAKGDVATDTQISCSVHLGTHIDAPSHFLLHGPTVESIALDTLIGPCTVLEISADGAIGPAELQAVWPTDNPTRILLRTPNSELWSTQGATFVESFAALSAAGARWLVDHGVRLVGIDYLSVQRFGDSPETHLQLLSAGVVILEGINLSAVDAGPYELTCLPLRLVGLEAAPARAVLRRPATDAKRTPAQA